MVAHDLPPKAVLLTLMQQRREEAPDRALVVLPDIQLAGIPFHQDGH